jgi:hypothetical protein
MKAAAAKTKIFGQHDEATLKQMVSAGEWPCVRTISLTPILEAAIYRGPGDGVDRQLFRPVVHGAN